jgi:O-antigen ligase
MIKIAQNSTLKSDMPEPSVRPNAGGLAGQPRLSPPSASGNGQALPVTFISLMLISQLFFYQGWVWPTIVKSVTPDRIMLVVLWLVYGVVLLGVRNDGTGSSKIDVLLMGSFAVLCTLSWLAGGSASEHLSDRSRWFATLLNLIYYPFSVYIIVKNTTYNRKCTIRLLQVMAGIGAYLVCTSVGEHYGISLLVWPKYILDPRVGIQFGRVRGPFASSVYMGHWLIAAFLAAALLLSYTKTRGRILLQMITIGALVGIYWTNQRSVWVGFACTLAILTVLGGKLRWQSVRIMLVLVLAFVLGFGSKFSMYQKTVFSTRQDTVDYRLANYKTAFKMAMDNMLTGVGYGNFVHKWRDYFGPEENALVDNLLDGNHNTYLGLFAESGIIAFVLYPLIFIYMMVQCFLRWRSRRPDYEFEGALAICAAAVTFAAMIEAFFSDMRYAPATNTLVFLLLGIVVSMRLGSSGKVHSHRGKPLMVVGTAR